jgi:DNA mismatch endonuclease (patch repair protein)
MWLVRENSGQDDVFRARALNEAKRRSMSRQRTRDTRPELAVRRRLHALGYRYRVDHRPLPDLRVRGDVVFTRARVVVFVDGCFWHRCPEHATSPRHNGAWWREKLSTNVARDRSTDRRLAEAGWRVVRIWEHEPPENAVARIRAVLKAALGPPRSAPRPAAPPRP